MWRVIPWSLPAGSRDDRACLLLADAASNPARLAAVPSIDGRLFRVDAPPPSELVGALAKRSDAQIMALELEAISFGLSRFAHHVRGRPINVYIRTTSAPSARCARRARNPSTTLASCTPCGCSLPR